VLRLSCGASGQGPGAGASNDRDRSPETAPLRLNRLHRAVLTGRRRIGFSAREFHLLEALVEREGEVCSRHDLAQLVWGGAIVGGPVLVDHYVDRLRGRLGDDFIETVEGSGYRYGAAK
jgi:DNA-binding response OmpR family regulator